MGHNQAVSSSKCIRSLVFIDPNFAVVPNCRRHFSPLDLLQNTNTYTFTDFLKYGAGIQIQI
jgi:hypothetical protein